MKPSQPLRRLFDVILAEAESNLPFGERLQAILSESRPPTQVRRPARRRSPGVIDPFRAFAEGEHVLREQLQRLDIEQLKDIVAEHGMDAAKLAMKWKTTDRLVDLIAATVRSRSSKGDAFRDRRD